MNTEKTEDMNHKEKCADFTGKSGDFAKMCEMMEKCCSGEGFTNCADLMETMMDMMKSGMCNWSKKEDTEKTSTKF